MSNKMDEIIVGMLVCLWNAYMCGLLQQTKETLSKFLTLPYMHVIVTRYSLTLVYMFCRLDRKKNRKIFDWAWHHRDYIDE
jgi:hypothetical protein